MERRKKIKANIEKRLASVYGSTFIYNKEFFLTKKGVPFHICTIEPDSLVVEYGDTWEDGDVFYADEMTEDEIFEAIIREVEAADRE